MTTKEMLDLALSYDDQIPGKGISQLDRASILLYLICYYYENNDNAAIQQIRERMNYYLKDGNEPSFSSGPKWYYALLCNSIALIKHSNTLWNAFDTDEQARMTILMRIFAYLWNFNCNSLNNYQTGWGLKGNYGKWRGPNYRLCNIGLIFPLVSFFEGLGNLNELFLTFDWEYEKSNLEKYNFNNALSVWTTPDFVDKTGKTYPGARTLLEQGGVAHVIDNSYGATNVYFGGSGVGVKTPFAFKDPYEDGGIVHFLYNNCFDRTSLCRSELYLKPLEEDELIKCHIRDNTTTPLEGQLGMMREFELANDGLGPRSSLFHCTTCFYLTSTLAITLKFLDIYNIENLLYYEYVQNGSEDFLYKVEHGWNGYSLGHIEMSNMAKYKGLQLWGAYWRQHYGKEINT